MKKDKYEVKRNSWKETIDLYENDPIKDRAISMSGENSEPRVLLFTVMSMIFALFSYTTYTEPGVLHIASTITTSLSILSTVLSAVFLILMILPEVKFLSDMFQKHPVKSARIENNRKYNMSTVNEIANDENTQKDFFQLLDIAEDLDDNEVEEILDSIIAHHENSKENEFSYTTTFKQIQAKERAEAIKFKYDYLDQLSQDHMVR